MARIRTIKPDFFRSDTVSSLPLRARLTWVGMWTAADDAGRLKYDARLIKSDVWPLDDDVTVDDVQADIDALIGLGRLVAYAVDGRGYLQITNWREHQKISNPTASKLPAPPAGPDTDSFGTVALDLAELSENPMEDSGSPPVTLPVGKERKGREKEGNGEGARKRATPAPDDLPITEDMLRWWRAKGRPDIDFNQQTAKFLDHHRAKGTTFKDWTAAWRTWMTRSIEYSPTRPTQYRPPADRDADGVPILIPDTHGWGRT